MPHFRFKLQPVLDQRQMIEDQCKRDLAQVVQQRVAMLGQLREMQQTITTSRQDLAGGLTGTVDMDQVAGFARYSLQARFSAQQIVMRLAQVEREIEQHRQRLVEASRQRKALELLRDKQYQQWLAVQERREAAELDEMATQRHAARVIDASDG